MSQCIYRPEVTLNNRVGDDDSASTEHIVPWAVGGSNGFTTQDASKRSNNDLGSEVDAPFANQLPIAIKRHELKIASQAGNIDPIIWPATTARGAKGKVTIFEDGTVEVDLPPDVQKDDEGRVKSVAGSRARVEPIIAGLVQGWRKRNETRYDASGKLLQSLEDCLSSADTELVDRLRCRVDYFDPEVWTRGILKITLGLCHNVVGPAWTFSENAKPIRAMVTNTKPNWPNTIPRGYIAGEWARNIRVALGKTASVRDSFQHTLAILPFTETGDIFAAVSLFGGNGVPEALIDLGSGHGFLERLSGTSADAVTIGYRLDPISRVTTPITFGQVNERNKRQGPTKKKDLDYILRGGE